MTTTKKKKMKKMRRTMKTTEKKTKKMRTTMPTKSPFGDNEGNASQKGSLMRIFD